MYLSEEGREGRGSLVLPSPAELRGEIREVRGLITEARRALEVGARLRELLSLWEATRSRKALITEMLAVLTCAEEAEEELTELYERLDGLEAELLEVAG